MRGNALEGEIRIWFNQKKLHRLLSPDGLDEIMMEGAYSLTLRNRAGELLLARVREGNVGGEDKEKYLQHIIECCDDNLEGEAKSLL